MYPQVKPSYLVEHGWLEYFASILLIFAVYGLYRRFLLVPEGLRDMPRVSIVLLLLSYASGETEDRRTQRLFLPLVNKRGEGAILVWTFGTWFVHCLDYKSGRAVMENHLFTKQPPPPHNLIWRFTGKANIFFIEGEQWKRQSKAVRAALHRATPIEQFTLLSRKLFTKIGEGGRISWSDLTHRFSLDAIGTTVLGCDFNALDNPSSPFVSQYHDVMAEIADPSYIFLPWLERWNPRTQLIKRLDALVDQFRDLLAAKKKDPGNDLITFMLEEPGMTDQEHRDNIIVLFMAGHDTTAGALSTLVYCLAKNPEIQNKARSEVLSVLGSADPTMEILANLPYLQACIRESMRFNSPSTTAIPRVASVPVQLGKYNIPPNTPVMLNMYGGLHNELVWANPYTFDPARFMGGIAGQENGWFPFGLGPRQCPARIFSLYEQRTLLAMLLREYKWILPDDSIHKDRIHNAFSAFALNLPHAMDIVFSRRV